MNTNLSTIDDYLSVFPPEVQASLEKIRRLIAKAAPKASEAIKYGIPTFVLNGNLIHFAAYRTHIGLYPTPDLINAFRTELQTYKTSKGAIQFPLDQPLPWKLIKKIIAYRIKQKHEEMKGR